ncbi:MAG: TonB family protein, partial [Candidatus Omnitrophota bacterium]
IGRIISAPDKAKDKNENEPLKRYYERISRIIDGHKRFPDLGELKRGGLREVTLKFTVFSGGLIDNVEVLKSSGVPFLDLLASKMIEDISSFPPFSAEMKQSYITFVVPVKYQP